MPDDFYRTPSAATRALIPHLGNVRSVLDPFCGDGAILAEFPSAERHGIEIDPVRAHLARHGTESKVALRDALDPGDWPRVDVIVTNPPFSLALPAINRMLAKAAEHGTDVVVLLRLNFMASQARATFHRANRSDIFVLPSRPSFAASLKCPACGWKATLDLRDERPKVCPTCGEYYGHDERLDGLRVFLLGAEAHGALGRAGDDARDGGCAVTNIDIDAVRAALATHAEILARPRCGPEAQSEFSTASFVVVRAAPALLAEIDRLRARVAEVEGERNDARRDAAIWQGVAERERERVDDALEDLGELNPHAGWLACLEVIRALPAPEART